ncbi:hypothetical protein [Photobacterium sp. J15]|uniref:hypothetical protein n=1 Tax=Photobacterium sp. J15 TaxID=265901 RepID=UPI000A87122E|nr:hypothetical protein [Photobacterium sp. J15]
MQHASPENTEFKLNSSSLPYVVIMLAAYVAWGLWISRFPLALTSDDALNFSRGVERFSVLEFRPHFPGYPAFIVLSRLTALWCESAIAPVWVSLLSAAAIPFLVARLIIILSGSWPAATLGCLLVLMQPLLASVALSGLSDSAAIVWFLLAMIAAMQQKSWMVGLWIGLMLATRPSYFPLALGMAIAPLLKSYAGFRLGAYFKASLAIACIGALSLLFIWFYDGAAYFEEGARFTQGHFAIWGNTAEGDSSSFWQWVTSLKDGIGWFGLIFVAVSLLHAGFWRAIAGIVSPTLSSTELKKQQLTLLAIIALLYWVWITIGQNPDNLRHWAPVLILFLVVFPVQQSCLIQTATVGSLRMKVAYVFGTGSIVYCLVLGYPSVYGTSRQAPIQQAIEWIKANPRVKVVGTNYSVNLLRDRLGGHGIYDMYYPSSQLALIDADKRTPQSAWRLSGMPLNNKCLVAKFEPRFIGERRLFLYQIGQCHRLLN